MHRLGFTTAKKGRKDRKEEGKGLTCLWVMRNNDACLCLLGRDSLDSALLEDGLH